MKWIFPIHLTDRMRILESSRDFQMEFSFSLMILTPVLQLNNASEVEVPLQKIGHKIEAFPCRKIKKS